MLESLQKFIDYWFYRYLLVTELYIVEKWERVMIHIVFFIFFACLSLFNYGVVLSAVDSVLTNKQDWMLLPPLQAIRNAI